MRFIVAFLGLLALAIQPAEAASSPNLLTLEQQLRTLAGLATRDVFDRDAEIVGGKLGIV